MRNILKTSLGLLTASLCLALTGCNNDNNDTVNHIGGNNNNGGVTPPSSTILKYNVFNRVYEGTDSALTNLTREETTISSSGISFATKGLLKFYTEPASEGFDYDIGDHYLAKHDDKDIGFIKNVQVNKVGADKYQVNFVSYGENNLKTNHSMTLKEIDISGVYDFAKKEAQGFNTWVNNTRFKKLPASITFPAGSGCFAYEQLTQDRMTFGFEEANVTNYTNLDSYLANQYGVITASIKKYNVGLNNEWQVVEYNTTNSDSQDYAVLYNGKVYDNAIKNELIENNNTDITKGEVDCEPLNTTAANYMEQQLIAAYK